MLVSIFRAYYKNIQNLQSSQAYIFHILQRFATKLFNFTNFRMLFNAVVINFPISTFFKILPVMESVHSTLGRSKIGKYMFCQYIFNIPNICLKFISLKSRIALQVARKIVPRDRAFERLLPHECNTFNRAFFSLAEENYRFYPLFDSASHHRSDSSDPGWVVLEVTVIVSCKKSERCLY